MAKSLLGCFLFSTRYSQISSTHISPKDLHAFYCSYFEDLNQLSKSFSHGSVSLKWPVEAMKILKKMQVELLVLIKKSSLPISFGAEDSHPFNQYMKDSIAILDFCNSLKLAVSRVDRYRMMVDIMINKLGRTDSSETVEFESQKYLNFSTLKETIKQYVGSCSDDENNNSVIVGVSVLLHSTIVSPISSKSDGCDLTCRYPQLKPFMEMLLTQAREFNDAYSAIQNSSRLDLIEHEIVVRVLVDIQAQVMDGIEDKERFLSSLELLRSSSVELKEGIEKLDAAVDDVFDVVIKGRNEMLGVLRDRDLSLELKF